MKIKELIAQLQKYDPENLVVIANHAEFVNFSVLDERGLREELFYEDPSYGAFVLDPEDATEYDRERSDKAIVLYPSVMTIPNW